MLSATTDLPNVDLVVVALAAAVAGMVNALAGGGTLITFPVLTAVGVPPLSANVTNTVALCPGYLGGALAQRRDLPDRPAEIWRFVAVGAAGGLAGAVLLVLTGSRLFDILVPFLILAATLLLALQRPIRRAVERRLADGPAGGQRVPWWSAGLVFLAGVYGGYFGGAMSIVLLAVLGLTLQDSLTRVNALKQVVALAVNLTAAAFLVFSGKVVWAAALVMAVGALGGGVAGGRLAGRIPEEALRRIVIAIGFAVAVVFFVRLL
jgi:uncharacterized membrane protein YfcA